MNFILYKLQFSDYKYNIVCLNSFLSSTGVVICCHINKILSMQNCNF